MSLQIIDGLKVADQVNFNWTDFEVRSQTSEDNTITTVPQGDQRYVNDVGS